MARRVGAAESKATSAKRREAIYSGKVIDWPWFKGKMSAKSVLDFVMIGGMMLMQPLTATTAAGMFTAKEIVKQESKSRASHELCAASQERVNKERVQAGTYVAIESYDAAVKMITNETEESNELLEAIEMIKKFDKRLSMGKTAVDMHKVKEIIDAMVMTKVFASTVDEIDISVLLWSPPEVNHKVVTNGMSTKGKTVETTMLRTPRLVVLAGAVRFVLGNMLHACTTCAWVKLQAMKAGVPDARVHTDEDEKEGARHC